MGCNHKEQEFIETPNFVHYGKMICKSCGLHIRWVTMPAKEGKRTRTSKKDIKTVLEFHNKKEEICFFCLRKRGDLGESETMTLDHIEELSNGGQDEIENMQILCSACHKLKNWTRLYLHWHLKK